MAFQWLYDVDPLDRSVLVLQDRYKSHLVDYSGMHFSYLVDLLIYLIC